MSAPVQGRFGAVIVTVSKIDTRGSQNLRRRGAANPQRDRLGARQENRPGHPRQDRGRPRRRRFARGSGAEVEAARRHLRRHRPLRPRSRRQADRESPPRQRSDQRRVRNRCRRRQRSARGRRRLYLVRRHRHHAGARAQSRRGEEPGRGAVARRRGRVAAQSQGGRYPRQAQERRHARGHGCRRRRAKSRPQADIKRSKPPEPISARDDRRRLPHRQGCLSAAPRATSRRNGSCSG